MRATTMVLAAACSLAACDSRDLHANAGPGDDDVGCDVDFGTVDAGDCQVGCGPGERRAQAGGRCEPACSIEQEVARLAHSGKTVDCGSLSRTADNAARVQAHQCLFLAITGGLPVKLVEWLQGIDSLIAHAYVGPGGSAPITRLEYDGSGGTSAVGIVNAQSCSTVRAEPECQVSAVSPCIECIEASAFETLCRTPPPGGASSRL